MLNVPFEKIGGNILNSASKTMGCRKVNINQKKNKLWFTEAQHVNLEVTKKIVIGIQSVYNYVTISKICNKVHMFVII